MTKFNFLSLSFIILFIPRCSSSNHTANLLLHDIWALETIEGEKIIIDETIKALPVLEIYVEEESVHGNTSCNTINGKVKIDGSKITFYDIITTEMACPGNVEQRFLSSLNKVNNYKIEKMKLYLSGGNRELLVLRKID